MTVPAVAPRETRKERLSRLFDKAASIEARLSKLSLAVPVEEVDEEVFEGRPFELAHEQRTMKVAETNASSTAAQMTSTMTTTTTTETTETHEAAAVHHSKSLDSTSSHHETSAVGSRTSMVEMPKTKTADYEPGLYMASSNRVTQNANELELLIGDLLQVTAILPGGWAFAMNLKTKDKGNVPLDCLERGVAASLDGSFSSTTKHTKETRTVRAEETVDGLNDVPKPMILESTSSTKTIVKEAIHESELAAPNSAPLIEEIKKSASLDTRMVAGAASRESIHTLIDHEDTRMRSQDTQLSPSLTVVMDNEQEQPVKEEYAVIRDRTPHKASELALFHGHKILVTLMFSDGWCHA
jgi:hypothetical protein